jgi:hypothetical protein
MHGEAEQGGCEADGQAWCRVCTRRRTSSTIVTASSRGGGPLQGTVLNFQPKKLAHAAWKHGRECPEHCTEQHKNTHLMCFFFHRLALRLPTLLWPGQGMTS